MHNGTRKTDTAPEVVRVYGRRLGTWTAWDEARAAEVVTQFEVEYTEYDAATGEVTATGSEDFTPERWRVDTVTAEAVEFLGALRRDGSRKWEHVRTVRVRRAHRRALATLAEAWASAEARAVVLRSI